MPFTRFCTNATPCARICGRSFCTALEKSVISSCAFAITVGRFVVIPCAKLEIAPLAVSIICGTACAIPLINPSTTCIPVWMMVGIILASCVIAFASHSPTASAAPCTPPSLMPCVNLESPSVPIWTNSLRVGERPSEIAI